MFRIAVVPILVLLKAGDFTLGEQRRLEFRWEMFNLTNTAQFGRPNLNVSLAQGGTITSTQTANRQMQLGLRLVF